MSDMRAAIWRKGLNVTRFRFATTILAASILGCDTPVVVLDGEGGGQIVILSDDDQGGGDAGSCTAKEDFPSVSPGDHVGNPFADQEFRDSYVDRGTELLSCLGCDGREISQEFCRFTDGETNLGGADAPAFNNVFSVEINDGEIVFYNDQTIAVIATGGINADGTFSAVGFEEKTTNGIDTAQWKYVQGTFDFQNRVIEMFARTRDSASDFLGGGPFDYEYTTQSRYEALVAP
jgi:hypothetical protein